MQYNVTACEGRLRPAAGKFVKKLVVERLAAISGPHRQKDVSADELVNDFTVRGQTLEDELLVLERDVELLELPVD